MGTGKHDETMKHKQKQKNYTKILNIVKKYKYELKILAALLSCVHLQKMKNQKKYIVVLTVSLLYCNVFCGHFAGLEIYGGQKGHVLHIFGNGLGALQNGVLFRVSWPCVLPTVTKYNQAYTR